MKHALLSLATLLMSLATHPAIAADAAARTNVLFIIADDASRSYGEAYGCRWVKTPHIDALAKKGLVFENAYTPTSKCAPSRASILTGRNPWQLEEAANHQPYFPVNYVAFSEAAAKAGVACGGAGKTWGPGDAKTADGKPRNFALKPTSGGKPNATPGVNLTAFLKNRPANTPFFYWFGSHHPHRGYKDGSGIQSGMKLTDIDRVPSYLPDNEKVRGDFLDYGLQVQAFDEQVGSLVAALEAAGEADNTLIIVTSDHGMPFPRVKGHTYDEAHHIPLIAVWPKGIAKPGTRVADFISFIDVAPTFLELLGVDGLANGMSPITGRSFTDLLLGQAKAARPFVIIGRERNDVLARPGSPAGLGYPTRGIRVGSLFYVRNFEADRWPCGNPDMGLKDTDAGPTKAFIMGLPQTDRFWQFAFGKRTTEELFDLATDPDCVKNLATDPQYTTRLADIRDTMMAELKKQADPRAVGKGEVFDQYLSPRTKQLETPKAVAK